MDSSSEDDEPIKKKTKGKKVKVKSDPDKQKKRKRVVEPDEAPSSSTSAAAATAKKAKTKELKKLDKAERLQYAMQAFLWWNAKDPPEGCQWSTMEHAGVSFPDQYQPHGIKMKYDGKPVDLTPLQEEAYVQIFWYIVNDFDAWWQLTFCIQIFHNVSSSYPHFFGGFGSQKCDIFRCDGS